MSKKTVVIGASDNPERYAYKATIALQKRNHEVIPVGIQDGEINGIKIIKEKIDIDNVDTITLYVGPKNQPSWFEYIIGLKPKRVIFNPGTENPEFEELLQQNNIETIEACTLVMLSIGNY
ncbi:MAG: CoA-binding protein [Bacteroidia bacterium]|nr:CoA-binding protein [Bacteroidia bacterium]